MAWRRGRVTAAAGWRVAAAQISSGGWSSGARQRSQACLQVLQITCPGPRRLKKRRGGGSWAATSHLRFIVALVPDQHQGTLIGAAHARLLGLEREVGTGERLLNRLVDGGEASHEVRHLVQKRVQWVCSQVGLAQV